MIRFIGLTIPEFLMTDQTFSPSERLIGFYIFANPDKIIPAEIVRVFQMSKNTVTKALGKFVKAGVLTRGSRFGDWKLSDEYAEQANPSNWETNPNMRKMNPNIGEMNPSNWEMNPNMSDSVEDGKEETKKERTKERSKEETDNGNPYGLPSVADDTTSLEFLSGSTDIQEVKSPCPYREIQDLFNEICISYPRVRGMGGTRRQLLSGRWSDYPDLDVFRQVFENAENSPFMRGQNKNGWTADFDWIIKPSNFQKVLEGKYNDRPQGAASSYQQSGDPFLAYMRAVANGEA